MKSLIIKSCPYLILICLFNSSCKREIESKIEKEIDITSFIAPLDPKLNTHKSDSLLKATQNTIPINLLKLDRDIVDEYNVTKQILEFRNTETGQIIKTIDVVQENPFHQMGFNRRKEPEPDLYYFLMKKGTENKYDLKEFLPKVLFSGNS